MTGNNAVVAILLATSPSINGIPLSLGDEIGAFTSDGLCCGACMWDGMQNVALTIWGDNDLTAVKDGMLPGDTIEYKFWRIATGKEYDVNEIGYESGPSLSTDGRYRINGLYVLQFASAPLPVQLTGFSVQAMARGMVRVSWSTASETNSYLFKVERKDREDTLWQFICEVPGKGTTLLPNNYSCVDVVPILGLYSYRLRQIDLDGKMTLFPEKELTAGMIPAAPAEQSSKALYWIILGIASGGLLLAWILTRNG
jgi:hypothetical protein